MGASAQCVCAPQGIFMCVLGAFIVSFFLFFSTCAHPVGQSPNSFTHSFTAPACHHTSSGARRFYTCTMRLPCLLLCEQHAGAPAERELQQISAQLYLSYWARKCRDKRFEWDLGQVINHVRMRTPKQSAAGTCLLMQARRE